MHPDQVALYWLIFGAILMALEALLPGLVVIFLGMGAMVVSLFIYQGWIEGWMTILTSWFIISLVFIVTLRSLFYRLLPGDTNYGEYDEDQDAAGTIVDVVQDIHRDDKNGRIKFRGTTWIAMSEKEPIPAGSKAKLVTRKDLIWYVTPHHED